VLDDIQWADVPSLNLAKALWTDREASLDLILVATSHSNVSDDHPFVERLRKGTVQVETIALSNLKNDGAVRSVVVNAMRESEDYAAGLADVVFEKTHGNAFFVGQWLQMLVNEGLLTYNIGLMKWLWDDKSIRALRVTYNMGSLLGRRIQTLSEPTQALLKIAACLGQVFEEETFYRLP
jgi:histidine kinase